jgi:hypothetical protein
MAYNSCIILSRRVLCEVVVFITTNHRLKKREKQWELIISTVIVVVLKA